MLRWSKKKKVIVCTIAVAALVCSFLFFIRYVPTGFVNAYTIAEHREAVKIDRVSTSGRGSPATYRVQSLRNPKLWFTVKVARSSILELPQNVIEDTYEDGQTTYQEQLKLDKVTGDIEKLGFHGIDEEDIILDFFPTHRDEDGVSLKTLNLVSEDELNFRQFKEEELPRLHQLKTLIDKSGADVSRIYIDDEYTLSHIRFDGYASTTPLSPEELYDYLRNTNWEISNYESQVKWESEFEKIENERFTLGTDSTDLIYQCTDFRDEGICNEISLTVRYEHNGLTSENEHLTADVTAILHLLEHTMTELESYDLFFVEELDNTWYKEVRFTNEEREQFESVEQLVEKMF
ncbi:hypothetical protein [Alkalihalophilus marmarensis]|uniref:Uncharacterized protein n=1 Tax=Alkalihalophilus marmarensis DSM 21297 TaxID=1188261 RepID=U6SKH3_9BACI|nr:hypothetical protein [Alkalihalophilus marmarensis]ERN51857.1 hypothetical protein A33I_18775 [Alkalihalophilus marmarensis DSM 21297]